MLVTTFFLVAPGPSLGSDDYKSIVIKLKRAKHSPRNKLILPFFFMVAPIKLWKFEDANDFFTIR